MNEVYEVSKLMEQGAAENKEGRRNRKTFFSTLFQNKVSEIRILSFEADRFFSLFQRNASECINHHILTLVRIYRKSPFLNKQRT